MRRLIRDEDVSPGAARRRLTAVACAMLSAVTWAALSIACSDDPVPTGAAATSDGGAPSGEASTPTGDGGVNLPQQRWSATATLKSASDAGSVSASATFVEQNAVVTATVVVGAGLAPGLHGVHIDSAGDCAAATTAPVAHWTVDGVAHGFPDSGAHHLGDMGNILISDAGVGSLVVASDVWRAHGDVATSVTDRALVIRAGTDDGSTQPDGDAGAAAACGVIRRLN